MSDGIVRRWAHYGHERLHVEDAGGVQLGYFHVHPGPHDAEEIDKLPLPTRAPLIQLECSNGRASKYSGPITD